MDMKKASKSHSHQIYRDKKYNKMKSSSYAVRKDIFHYQLPNGGLKTCSYILPDNNIKFDPPVYEQRYTTVVRVIQDERWWRRSGDDGDVGGGRFKKIADFGCGEMRLLPFLKRIPYVEHILEIDIDRETLINNQTKAIPIMWDYLHNREIPLRIEVLCGNIIESDVHLHDIDVVIGLELIEHLTKDVLEKLPENVFNVIKPKLVIFSTPNVEFNVLFPKLLANGFRHDDHKFEWTRKEFHSWAFNICEMYPNYKVAFLGLGKPPNNRKHLGYATQLAIFARNDLLNDEPEQQQQQQQQQQQNKPDELQNEKYVKNPYEEIYVVDYPYKPDNRTLEEKIIQEIRYLIHRFRFTPNYFNADCNMYQLPLNTLLELIINKWPNVTKHQFLDIVHKMDDLHIENDCIILPEYDHDDNDDNDNNDNDENDDNDNDDNDNNDNDDNDYNNDNDYGGDYDEAPAAPALSNNVTTNYVEEENWD